MGRSKLILFDVDGTLLSPGPVPRQAMAEAIGGFVGAEISLGFHDVAGMTDPIIVRNALLRHGVADQGTRTDAVDGIIADYLLLLEKRLPSSNEVQVFPGAAELVEACKAEGWVTALLTGNVEAGARRKLARSGLWEEFAFGIFGDDGQTRDDLPWLARERAWEAVHEAYQPSDTILVGDTPDDARIARLSGQRSLIVCRRAEPEWRTAIEKEGPTWLVDNFDDVAGLIHLMKAETR